jgi:hypothetical protein
VLDPPQELAAIVDALNAAGVEYALCGGLAMAVHGEVVATADVDLLVREEDVTRVRDVVPDGNSLKLHLLLAAPALEKVWREREHRDWRGANVSVVSRAGMKSLEDVPPEHANPPTEKVPVDMSPEAITMRIRRVSQLRKLCLSLGKARPVPRKA